MMLTTLKYGDQWDSLFNVVNVRGSTFEKRIMGYTRIVSEFVYITFAVKIADDSAMGHALENKVLFGHFKYARYATDVTLRQGNRSSGNI